MAGAPPSSGPVRRRGLWAWASYDWASNAFATVIQTFVFAAYFQNRVVVDAATGTTYWGLTLGAAGLLVALIGPVLGAIADRAGRRKPWLAIGTVVACIAIAGMWFVEPEQADVPLALGLLALAALGSETAMIFYNAMLPSLVANDRLGRWSGIGWSAGYGGGLACLLLVLVGFTGENPWFPITESDARNVRAVFPMTAAWYLLFSLPLLILTPDQARRMAFRPAVRAGLGQIRDSLRRLHHLRGVLKFLIARLLYTDGLSTMFAFGGIYAAGTFGMGEREVLWFGIALNLAAGVGAAGLSRYTDRIGSRRTVLISLGCLILSTGTILLIEDLILFWTLGMVMGLAVGPVQAASRSLMAHLAPEELRTQLFGLYAFSGKATTFIGPLLVGWLAAITDSQRLALTVVPAALLLGLLLLLLVPDPESRK
ncbi:MAG: MFS transporter [Planctomycetota bacterium]